MPVLIDIKPSDVTMPLASFQGRPLDKDGMKRLVQDISAKRESPMPREQVDALFAAMWPQLESAVDEAVRNAAPSREPQRSQESCACFNRSAASKASCSSRAYISARAALWVARRSSTSPGSTWLSPKPQFRTSARTAAFALTWPAAPPCHRHTVPPGIAFALHCLPVRLEIALNRYGLRHAVDR